MNKFKLLFLYALSFILLGCFDQGSPRLRQAHLSAERPKAWANIQKVITIVLENTDFENAVDQPFIKRLAQEGAVLNRYYGITHPSQPNYIALISGSTQGINHNNDASISGSHIGDLLESSGKTWKSYAEDYPGNCFLGSSSGTYVRRHEPFLSFKSVQTSPSKCKQVVNADQFITDLRAQSLPHFGLYVPDLNNDGHDTGISFADRWLAGFFSPIFENTELLKDTLFIVTFDEGSTSKDNRIVTIFYGHSVRAGAKSNQEYDHYCLLRTIEEIFNLPHLGKYDQFAPAIDDIWVN